MSAFLTSSANLQSLLTGKKVKLSLTLKKHHAMKTYGGVEV
jgi:hypothetical protein